MSEVVQRRRRDKRTKYLILGVFVAVALFAFLNHRFRDNEAAEAANLANFDPGYIMSDWQMSNYNSMSEADIQNFLWSKGRCYNTNFGSVGTRVDYFSDSTPPTTWHVRDGHTVCLAEENMNGETAAHIIWQTAQDYRINPQVLIVLLQKETGMITDPIPNSWDYQRAAGYGCPDTAACSSKYYGFKNQIRNAAALFRTVLDGGWTNYPLGWNYVQYNPNAGCGGTSVNIRSLATSALYRYTPYQPNGAALAAGYGYGDSCSAYGNRNFYSYFEDWFGGAVEEKSYVGVSVGSALSGTYKITSVLNGNKAIDVAGGAEKARDGTNVQAWNLNGSSAQVWRFDYNESDDTYMIINPASGKALDVLGAGTNNGTNIQVWTSHESCAQKWKITKSSEYGYVFTSVCSDKVLDLTGASTDNGTNIQLWERNGSLAQEWGLTRTE